MTHADCKVNIPDRELQMGDWEQVGSYLSRCFGNSGDELGDVPVSICACGPKDNEDVTYYAVAETSGGSFEIHGVYTTRAAAEEAAEELCADMDEAPDLDEIIERIEETGYFEDPEIIPLIIEEATRHTQGYILVTPDISQPVGVRWTTNGYLQCPYIAIDATYDYKEMAAQALLDAILTREEDDED